MSRAEIDSFMFKGSNTEYGTELVDTVTLA